MLKVRRIIAVSVAVLMVMSVLTPSLLALERHSSVDRYTTAVEISKAGWEQGADVVVLARGDFYADALAGVPLAYANDAPILLTEPDELPRAAKEEILRLEASKVYILGGLTAVSQEVENEVKAQGVEVVRISGANRYETAAAISGEIAPNGADVVFLAYGLNFPDALAAASYAAASGSPILLTLSDELPEETLTALEDLDPSQVYVVGGSAIISDEILEELNNAERISGRDRYETAVALAEKFGKEATLMYIATGANASGGADAITGAALAAQKDTGILLVGSFLPNSVASYLSENIYDAVVLGGRSAVSNSVAQAIEDALKVETVWTPPTKPAISTYRFEYELPDDICSDEDVLVNVALATNVLGRSGYDTVRFNFETVCPDGGGVAFTAEDSAGNEYTFTDSGEWGPPEGFNLDANYSEDTDWTLKFTAPGDYTITFRLVDLAEDAVIVENSIEIEVIALWKSIADKEWFDDETYIITSAAELAGLAELVNTGTDFSGKTIILGADIDLQGRRWTPIGTKDNKFRGTFDGDNHKILNLIVENFDAAGAGLFGYVDSSEVRDLTIENVSIDAQSYVGALVGNFYRGTVENVHVKNATIIGQDDTNSGNYIGGVVGWGYFDISNCTVTDSHIQGNGISIGGLVGFKGEGSYTIADCTVKNTDVSGYFRTGGLAGLLHHGNQVSDSHVDGGTVTSRIYESSVESLRGMIIKTGGLIGDVFTTTADVTIRNCSTTAEIGGDSANYHPSVGPFIGNVDDGPDGILIVEDCKENGNPVDYTLISTNAELNTALAGAAENDSIFVGPGTYEIDTIGVKGLNLKSFRGAEETSIVGVTINITADNVTIDGFTIDNTDGDRAIAPRSSTGTTIKNNIIRNSLRGIQGDFYGQPTNLTITGNTFETQYGIASTEGMTGLTVTGNTFKTTVEAIGLGKGVELVGNPGDYVEHLNSENFFELISGDGVVDYRIIPIP